MKTLIFKLKNNDNNVETIKSLQQDYSVCFRQIYNNLDLIKDDNFMGSLRIKSSKLKEYLIKETIAFDEKRSYNLKKIQENIDELNSYEKLNPKQFKHLKYLERSIKSKIVFGGKINLIKRSKNLITKEEWKDKRLYPLVFYGETSRKGNRFFDFKELVNGKLLFKMESTDIKLNLEISTNKHKKEIKLLQYLTTDKKIPISVKLTHSHIHLSFDESILYESNLDIRKLHKECPFEKGSVDKKQWYRSKYTEHEDYLKRGKLDRYLSVDLNPNKIGFVITNNQMNLIDKGSMEIELLNSVKYSNKRKYNYSIIIKELFKLIEHYKVSYFVIEELDINKDNHGNKESNRKIKQEWMLNYLKELIVRRCNETKTILIEVPAYYSSFIGNLTYRMYDPISSAYELCRRGINKFKKGFKMIPEYNPNNINTDRIDGDIDLGSYKSFVECFKAIRNQSYRRNDKSFSKYLLSQCTNISVYI